MRGDKSNIQGQTDLHNRWIQVSRSDLIKEAALAVGVKRKIMQG